LSSANPAASASYTWEGSGAWISRGRHDWTQALLRGTVWGRLWAAHSSARRKAIAAAMAAASSGPAPPRISIGSLIDNLHELDERTGKGDWVHEGDTVPPATDPGVVIEEAHSLDAEVLEGFIDVGDGKSDMVHAFAAPLQESPQRRIRLQRLKQLNVRAADGDHCFLDALVRYHLAADGLDSVLIAELM
jgi:hypothetical protein